MKALVIAVVFGFFLIASADSTNQTANGVGEALHTRSYKIHPGTFLESLKKATPAKAAETNQELLIRHLKENGIEVKPPGAVLLDEKGARVLIRTNKEQLARFQTLFEKNTGLGERLSATAEK